MINRLQKKGKKGFTLVELIVVIAIIAILAAVAVPTTMHFVDKANASKEGQQMNISTSVDNFIAEAISTPMNIRENMGTKAAKTSVSDATTNAIAAKLFAMDENTNIGSIIVQVNATEKAADKHTVKFLILGNEYADWKEAQIVGTVSMKLSNDQIYKKTAAEIADSSAYDDYVLLEHYFVFNFKASEPYDVATKGETGKLATIAEYAVGDLNAKIAELLPTTAIG